MLTFTIVEKNTNYIENLTNDYYKIPDFYIQESIIHVLSSTISGNDTIINFFNKLISSDKYLTAKSIRRIADYLGDPRSYITWNRKNLYNYDANSSISADLRCLLFNIESFDKDSFPIKCKDISDKIPEYRCFLATDKHKIKEINDYLHSNYSCVCTGDCKGSSVFPKIVIDEINSIAKIVPLDKPSFYQSFEKVLNYIFDYYDISDYKIIDKMHREEFEHSVFAKFFDIATGIYYGSLMCNYYTQEFNITDKTIGYNVYDPLPDREEIYLTFPIPTHNHNIELLGDIVANSLDSPQNKDIGWVKDIEISKRNVINLLNPVNKGKNDWILLAGIVSFSDNPGYNELYHIYCCTSAVETLTDFQSSGHLTIEAEKYIGNLKSYSENNYKPWLCKHIQNTGFYFNDVFEETTLILPPSEIIKHFNLHLNISDFSWRNENNEKIILCNNNKHSYYHDRISGTVFMRKDYYDKFLQEHKIKFFAYTEKCIPREKYKNVPKLHLEIFEGKIVKEFTPN